MVVDINDAVKWVGVIDKDIVTFDIVMETQYGTSYNSYFIDADKKAVIDTAKETFKDEYLSNIKEVADPQQIEVIVTNHTEPDHSGNIAHLLELSPNATVYGSRQAINYLNEMINRPFKSQVVKDGDSLSLGNKTLKFISAPNLHWPDSIYTYLEEDKMLFTCDSFGAHFASEELFDDKVGDYSDAFQYYFDVILKPFSKFMLKAIDKISALDYEIICPGHGPILRSTSKEVVEKTRKLSQQYLSESNCDGYNVLITYVSAYGYTKKMAKLIAEGIKSKSNCAVNVVDIENIMMGELEELIVNSNALIIGSPTINQNTVLPIYRMFSLINPIRDKGKKATAFGSYGWSGEAVGLIENFLKSLKLKIISEGISSKFSPGNDDSKSLIEFGENIAKALYDE